MNHSRKNVRAAEGRAKAYANGMKKDGKYGLFAIVNHKAKGGGNAGGDTAHLAGTLIRDGLHEIGHLKPFKLGHAGVYENGKLDRTGDGTSFMSRFATTRLNGPQLYYLGWLPVKKVGLHETDYPVMDYKMEALFAKNTAEQDSLKGILIPRKEGRDLFLSTFVKDKTILFSLYYMTNGGTQRVKLFNKNAESDGLVFERLTYPDDSFGVRVGPKTSSK